MWSQLDLVLASKSPRRKELLERMGLTFRIVPSLVEEIHPPGIHPLLLSEHLAQEKALEVFNRIDTNEDTVVIGADSVVILGERIFEKPKDYDEAFSMLAHLSGRQHLVTTGVCLKSNQQMLTFSGKSYVTFRPLDGDEIDFYLKTYEPYDKAGSYGVQDWMGMCKVSSIEGTYTNVMGLPTDLVYEGLKNMLSPQ